MPWFHREPTQEEEEQMNNQDDKVTTETVQSKIPGGFLATLQTEIHWDISNKEGIKQVSLELAQILSSHDSPIAIPKSTDTLKLRMEVGKAILQNKDKSMEDIIQMVADKYGLKENKEKE